ncbi:MAG: hypothetical protein E5X35_07625 [Mesorhizobium sp.]|uniref:hypothetical protein n=1 Tax=Mesorhizobium sp. TaxID=1871066 RepID=UPI001214EC0F|nr:hypothetical protein [Mesorhizobium sp.]TIR34574.1 MAG: hypothetical protein E5X35_07625 [Mesorhizobium sp.]
MKKPKKTAAPAGAEAILPLTDFREDAWGDGNLVAFKAGILSSPVPAEFAQKMRDAGKAAGKKSAPTGGTQSAQD